MPASLNFLLTYEIQPLLCHDIAVKLKIILIDFVNFRVKTVQVSCVFKLLGPS